MTKSHILIYVLAVLGITISAYLYTSTVEAPHGLTYEEDVVEVIPEVTPDNSPAPTPPQAEVKVEDTNENSSARESLIDRTWLWSYTEDAAGQKIFTPKQKNAFRMQFTDLQMSSATDCNTIGGSYDIVGSRLSFGPLMSTLMYCEGSEESTYSASLGAVTSYEISKDKLLLKNHDGETMVFVSLEL